MDDDAARNFSIGERSEPRLHRALHSPLKCLSSTSAGSRRARPFLDRARKWLSARPPAAKAAPLQAVPRERTISRARSAHVLAELRAQSEFRHLIAQELPLLGAPALTRPRPHRARLVVHEPDQSAGRAQIKGPGDRHRRAHLQIALQTHLGKDVVRWFAPSEIVARSPGAKRACTRAVAERLAETSK